MKRRIIQIDRSRCTGCRSCIPDCPEGALRVIDGKAALVSDLHCDGLGACVGTCPEGAISVVEREAGAYDERAVMAGIAPQGEGVIRAHLEHLLGHGELGLYRQAVAYLEEHGIPVPEYSADAEPEAPPPGEEEKGVPTAPGTSETGPAAPSALRQWPVQLRLVNPASPWFEDADLLVAADCAPFAYAGFHSSFLEGRRLLIFCPKLDREVDEYIDKLTEIFTRHRVRSVTVVRMEVPCCGGVRYVVERALERAGVRLPVDEAIVSIRGEVRQPAG